MAEIKRIPLQSAPLQDVPKQAAKKPETKIKEKQIAPSFRFVINLPESNEKKCPEFNYSELLKMDEKKRKKEKKKDENNASNGLNIFDENADDEKILDVARYYEQKYGNRKKSDYIDLGAGYDESDSFIDNTEAYDELVPEEITTAQGGFYVNCGPLVYKNSDNALSLKRNHFDNGNDDDDDEEEESSDEDSDENEETTSKPVSKRSLSSSDEIEESTRPPKSKSRREEPPEINLVE